MFLQPYLVKSLTTDAAAQMGVKLQEGKCIGGVVSVDGTLIVTASQE